MEHTPLIYYIMCTWPDGSHIAWTAERHEATGWGWFIGFLPDGFPIR